MFKKKRNIADDDDLNRASENLKQGGAEAFHILYNNYQQKVYRFCLRMLGDPDAARDAFQETFIKVFEHRKDFRGSNFAAWLFTIARHTCLNSIRSKKEHEVFDEVYHSSGSGSESDIGMKEFIQQSISQLPVALREALLLREYEECSYQEIAVILGIDLSLAKVRVHRARLLLQKLLQPLVKEINEK